MKYSTSVSWSSRNRTVKPFLLGLLGRTSSTGDGPNADPPAGRDIPPGAAPGFGAPSDFMTELRRLLVPDEAAGPETAAPPPATVEARGT